MMEQQSLSVALVVIRRWEEVQVWVRLHLQILAQDYVIMIPQLDRKFAQGEVSKKQIGPPSCHAWGADKSASMQMRCACYL
jgi:hypothetical protein